MPAPEDRCLAARAARHRLRDEETRVRRRHPTGVGAKGSRQPGGWQARRIGEARRKAGPPGREKDCAGSRRARRDRSDRMHICTPRPVHRTPSCSSAVAQRVACAECSPSRHDRSAKMRSTPARRVRGRASVAIDCSPASRRAEQGRCGHARARPAHLNRQCMSPAIDFTAIPQSTAVNRRACGQGGTKIRLRERVKVGWTRCANLRPESARRPRSPKALAQE